MKAEKRLVYVDIAKGIGIILVVIGHLLPDYNDFKAFIYSFHMPLFFILSGLTLKMDKNANLQFVVKKQSKIAKQYIMYSLIFVIYDIVVKTLALKIMDYRSLVWNLYNFINLFGINVLWFLSTLCIVRIIVTFMIMKCGEKWALSMGFFAYVIVGVIGKYVNVSSMSNNLIQAAIYYPLVAVLRPISVSIFLLLGFRLKAFFEKVECDLIERKGWILLFSIITLSMVFVTAKNNQNVDIRYIMYDNVLITLLTGILASCAIISISILFVRILQVKKILTFCGKNTVMIMALHEYLLVSYLAKNISEKIVSNCIWLYIVLTCAITFFIVAVFNNIEHKIKTRWRDE